MEIYNVSNINQAIKEYALYKIKEKYPLLDTTENSPINDILINPLGTILEPLIKEIINLEFKQNLSNAEHMSKEELDDIGQGNYFIPRNKGTKAVGEVILSFDSSIGNTGIIIPQGVILSDAGKTLNFTISREYNLTKDELFIYYNSLSYSYEIPVMVEAEDVGSKYNIGEGSIVNIDKFSPALKQVSNSSKFDKGSDEESNINYAARIEQFYVSRQLGTEPGYRQFVLENFSEVIDVFVVGKDHPMMNRDLITVQKEDLSTYTDHLGGKVDLYVRGSNMQNEVVNITSKSNTFKLIDTNININTISCKNAEDIVAFVVLEQTNDYVIITVDEIEGVTTQWVNGDNITVEYATTAAPEVIKTKVFTIDDVNFIPKSPFLSIISIRNTTQNTEYNLTDESLYEITYAEEQFKKTSKENCIINILKSQKVFNEDVLLITYSYNKTINSLNDLYNVIGNRIITTDIMIAEANPIYINLGMNIKLKENQVLDSTKLGVIRNCISNYLSKVELGRTVEESDIIGELYMDSNVSGFLQYVALPFTTFYKDTSATSNFEPGKRESTFISLNTIEYPLLNFSDIKEIS